jgi:hypothetical protein
MKVGTERALVGPDWDQLSVTDVGDVDDRPVGGVFITIRHLAGAITPLGLGDEALHQKIQSSR